MVTTGRHAANCNPEMQFSVSHLKSSNADGTSVLRLWRRRSPSQECIEPAMVWHVKDANDVYQGRASVHFMTGVWRQNADPTPHDGTAVSVFKIAAASNLEAEHEIRAIEHLRSCCEAEGDGNVTAPPHNSPSAVDLGVRTALRFACVVPEYVAYGLFFDTPASITCARHAGLDLCTHIRKATAGVCSHLGKPAFPMSTTLKIVTQVASAVDALHRLGLAHGDIKTENIVMSPEGGGCAQLIDFGSMRCADGQSFNDASCGPLSGTPCNAPPEWWLQSMNDVKGSKAGDVWCIGMVIRAMLTSRSIPMVWDTRRKMPIAEWPTRLPVDICLPMHAVHRDLRHCTIGACIIHAKQAMADDKAWHAHGAPLLADCLRALLLGCLLACPDRRWTCAQIITAARKHRHALPPHVRLA